MIGFVVFGVAVLNYVTEWCGSFSRTAMFVFWSQISDTLGDTAVGIYDVSFLIGIIFWFAVAAFGTMFVWSLITTIIEDSYMEVKYKKTDDDDFFGLAPQRGALQNEGFGEGDGNEDDGTKSSSSSGSGGKLNHLQFM